MTSILVTRPRKDAETFAALAREFGFETIPFPTIEIRPLEENPALRHALNHLDAYDWILFTSANAVPPFFTAKKADAARADGGMIPRRTRVAAVGEKTAAALRARRVRVDFVPARFVSDEILAGLGEIRNRWMLYPAAEIARDVLPQAIVRAGGTVHQITVYRTLPAAPDPQGLSALREGVDWLTFTSPSTVRNFITLTRRAGLNPFQLAGSPRVACIGPVTAEAARELGFRVDAVAEPHTAEGLLAAIQAHINDRLPDYR